MRERIEALIRDYQKNKMELKCLEHQIRNFRGISEIEMIDTMYFSQASWDELADKHFVGRTTIWRYRQKAIDELVVLYEKHEAEMTAYMLS